MKYKSYTGFSLHSINDREKKGEKVIILKYSFSRGLAGMWTLCNDGNHSRGAGTWKTHVLERVCTTSNHLRARCWPGKVSAPPMVGLWGHAKQSW